MKDKTSDAIKELILDVLNAKSTDEGGSAIYRHGQLIAPDLFKTAVGIRFTFPLLGAFGSQFDPAELLILKLLHNRERLRSTINERLSGELGVLAYDVEKGKFRFTTYDFEQVGDGDFKRNPSEDEEASEDEVENCIRKYCPNTDFDTSLYVNFEDYKDHEVALSKRMSSISVPRTKEIFDQLQKYNELVTEHDVIRSIQIELIMLADEFASGKKISPRSFLIKVITRRFERISRVKCYVNKQGVIIIDLALVVMSFDRTALENSRYKTYEDFVTWCLIRFLMEERNQKLIKRCTWCNAYFLAQKVDNRVRFCPTCSKLNKYTKERRREYQQEYREQDEHIKNRRQRKEYEKAIAETIKKFRYTRGEAEEYLAPDK